MLQSKNCIRTGEILLDENLHSFILCNSCHNDFYDMNMYHRHLKQCNEFSKIFQNGMQLVYSPNICEQLMVTNKCGQLLQQYLIYNWKDVKLLASSRVANSVQEICPKNNNNNNNNYNKNIIINNKSNSNNNRKCENKKIFTIDLMNIEEELMDPRWYNDTPDSMAKDQQIDKKSPTKRTLHYDELVEAVTPFVQFKENNTTSHTTTDQANNDPAPVPPIKRPMLKMNGSTAIEEKQLPANHNNLRFRMSTAASKVVKGEQITSRRIASSPTVTAAKRRIQPQVTSVQQQNPLIAKSDCPALSSAIISNRGEKSIMEGTSCQSNTSNYTPNGDYNSITSPTLAITSIATFPAPTPPASAPAPALHKVAVTPSLQKQTETAQILNKLQTRGLQIKRTNPCGVSGNRIRSDNTKILELLSKLQSKGMKVSVRRQGSTATENGGIHLTGVEGGGAGNVTGRLNSFISPVSSSGSSLEPINQISQPPATANNVLASPISTFKNVVIRKVTIDKEQYPRQA